MRTLLVALVIAILVWLVIVATPMLAGRKVEAKQLAGCSRISPRFFEVCSAIGASREARGPSLRPRSCGSCPPSISCRSSCP
jgi:hypothetical protein